MLSRSLNERGKRFCAFIQGFEGNAEQIKVDRKYLLIISYSDVCVRDVLSSSLRVMCTDKRHVFRFTCVLRDTLSSHRCVTQRV